MNRLDLKQRSVSPLSRSDESLVDPIDQEAYAYMISELKERIVNDDFQRYHEGVRVFSENRRLNMTQSRQMMDCILQDYRDNPANYTLRLPMAFSSILSRIVEVWTQEFGMADYYLDIATRFVHYYQNMARKFQGLSPLPHKPPLIRMDSPNQINWVPNE